MKNVSFFLYFPSTQLPSVEAATVVVFFFFSSFHLYFMDV